MRTVFTGGRVFDGTGAAVAEADVAVVDGRIVDVGAGLDGDEEVDVGGRTLLPGLFDCHVHVMFGHVDIWRHLQTPFSYRFYDAIRNLEATLRVGITTVRDAGGADLGVKQAVEEGIVAGRGCRSRITMLSQTGGHGDDWMPSGGRGRLLRRTTPACRARSSTGPTRCAARSASCIRDGADVIKVATSGGVLSPRDDPRHAHFRPTELEVLVAEATAAGVS